MQADITEWFQAKILLVKRSERWIELGREHTVMPELAECLMKPAKPGEEINETQRQSGLPRGEVKNFQYVLSLG